MEMAFVQIFQSAHESFPGHGNIHGIFISRCQCLIQKTQDLIWMSSSYSPMHFPSYNTLNFELIFFMKNKISKNWSKDKFSYIMHVKGLWFFNLKIIGKCQTRFEGGTKCHLLFSYSVILLYFTSSVCIRLFNMCTWCTGNITGSFIFSDNWYSLQLERGKDGC